jgi:hypothetical protein
LRILSFVFTKTATYSVAKNIGLLQKLTPRAGTTVYQPGYERNSWGFEYRKGQGFFSYPRLKLSEHSGDLPHTSRIEVKKVCNYTSAPCICLQGVHSDKSRFLYPLKAYTGDICKL